MDLWNKIGNSSSAADKEIASNIATLQSAKDTLAANIMRSWLQISLQKQLIAIEMQRLTVLENNEGLILQKYRSGLGDLQSAFYDIEAQAFKTKAAYKARLPSLSLKVALSDVADSPAEALLTSPLWSILGQLSALSGDPVDSGQ